MANKANSNNNNNKENIVEPLSQYLATPTVSTTINIEQSSNKQSSIENVSNLQTNNTKNNYASISKSNASTTKNPSDLPSLITIFDKVRLSTSKHAQKILNYLEKEDLDRIENFSELHPGAKFHEKAAGKRQVLMGILGDIDQGRMECAIEMAYELVYETEKENSAAKKILVAPSQIYTLFKEAVKSYKPTKNEQIGIKLKAYFLDEIKELKHDVKIEQTGEANTWKVYCDVHKSYFGIPLRKSGNIDLSNLVRHFEKAHIDANKACEYLPMDVNEMQAQKKQRIEDTKEKSDVLQVEKSTNQSQSSSHAETNIGNNATE